MNRWQAFGGGVGCPVADRTSFEVTVLATDGAVKVGVVGDLDCASGPRVRHVLAGLVDEERPVIVDLRATEFVDCAGIDTLAVAHDTRSRLGRQLVLEAPSRAATRVLAATGLVERIPTTADDRCEPAAGAR